MVDSYTLCRSLSNILNLSCLAVWTSAFAINAKHVFFAVPCIMSQKIFSFVCCGMRELMPQYAAEHQKTISAV